MDKIKVLLVEDEETLAMIIKDTLEEEVSGFAIADLNEIKRYADEEIFLHYDSIRQAFEE